MHRARIALFNKRNAYNKVRGLTNKKYRKCNDMETLPFCSTTVHYNLYKKRHSAVVDRIKKAAMSRWSAVREDRAVGSDNLRPDLVLKKIHELLILGITVPFENGTEAFVVARRTNEEKYRELAL